MKNIIVVGGGAGGLELVVGLSKKYRNSSEYKIILVDKEKTHVWKPHLHEIASGILSQHAEQLDYLHLANKFSFDFIWGELDELDKDSKTIKLKSKVNKNLEEILPARGFQYENLIISVGSKSNHFNTPGVKEHSFSLDDLDSSNEFHQIMLEKLFKMEYFEHRNDPFKITIIGGGATGTELAASLTSTTKKLSQFGLHKLKNHPVEITLVNAADQLLPGMSKKISEGAKTILESSGVKILNSTKVVSLEKENAIIEINGVQKKLYADLQVWAAGVKCQQFLSTLGLETNKVNQFIVNGKLQTSDKSIFAIGDCASTKWINAPKDGMTVPPRAQSAHQMSDYLIKNLDKINKNISTPDFIYRDFGSLISLGSSETVGTLMGFLQGKSLFIEGKIAKLMYLHLYQHHQIKINGFIPAFFLLIGKLIQKRFKPQVKLH